MHSKTMLSASLWLALLTCSFLAFPARANGQWWNFGSSEDGDGSTAETTSVSLPTPASYEDEAITSLLAVRDIAEEATDVPIEARGEIRDWFDKAGERVGGKMHSIFRRDEKPGNNLFTDFWRRDADSTSDFTDVGSLTRRTIEAEATSAAAYNHDDHFDFAKHLYARDPSLYALWSRAIAAMHEEPSATQVHIHPRHADFHQPEFPPHLHGERSIHTLPRRDEDAEETLQTRNELQDQEAELNQSIESEQPDAPIGAPVATAPPPKPSVHIFDLVQDKLSSIQHAKRGEVEEFEMLNDHPRPSLWWTTSIPSGTGPASASTKRYGPPASSVQLPPLTSDSPPPRHGHHARDLEDDTAAELEATREWYAKRAAEPIDEFGFESDDDDDDNIDDELQKRTLEADAALQAEATRTWWAKRAAQPEAEAEAEAEEHTPGDGHWEEDAGHFKAVG